MSIASSEPRSAPIKIVFVTEDGSIPGMYEEIMDTLQQACIENGFTLSLRTFDSWKYSCDRNEIASLPAFHIYVNDLWKLTTYPDDHPFEKLDVCIQEYRQREQRRLEKKRDSWLKMMLFSIPRISSQGSIQEARSTPPVTEWGTNPMHD